MCRTSSLGCKIQMSGSESQKGAKCNLHTLNGQNVTWGKKYKPIGSLSCNVSNLVFASRTKISVY